VVQNNQKSAYAILGLHKGVSFADVKKAYFELVKKYDPERHTERFMVVDRAFHILKDPAMRAKEDVGAFNYIKGEFFFSDDEKLDAPDVKVKQGIKMLEDKITSGEITEDQIKPKLILGHMILSWKFLKKKLWAEVIHQWETVLKLDPTHRRAKNNILFARVTLGYNYATHELYDEAAELWTSAVLMDPDNQKIIHNLALAYEKAGHTNEATRYWDETVKRWKAQLQKEPDNEYLKSCIIEVLRMTSERPDPRETTAGGTATTSSQRAGANNQAHARQGGQDPDTKSRRKSSNNIEDYREILKLNPDDFEAHNRIANLLYQEGKWTEAAKELMELRKKFPRNIEVLNLLGWAMLNDGKVDQAFLMWKKGLNIDKSNMQLIESMIKAHMSMGRILREKGLYTPCLKHFKELLKFQPDSDEVHFEIGQAYQLKGDERSAFTSYNRVLELNPKHRAARHGLSTLKLKR
jgi:tetratricopeptide (TPR) repeat protein